jgi:saccharopine dehydrogenase-like NADP-dependent oxidoreductase
MKIIVFGAGLVGNAIIRDLAADKVFEILAVDLDQGALNRLEGTPGVKTHQANLTKKGTIKKLTKDFDLVISAVPGFMGFQVLEEIIQSGKNVVDISFFGQDALELDSLAKKKGVTAIVDCGVAPGLCNIIAGYVTEKMDQPLRYACYVGGLPKDPQWPYEYKAVFSPTDVIEEYIRPARMFENGKEVIYPALSGIELIEFPEVGILEAFNTDGLRSLLQTLKIPNMKEKTLRYPGHAELMRIFRESGFFGQDPVDVKGQNIIPLNLTSELLFDQWHLASGEEDLTVMQVILEGKVGKEYTIYQYDLLDYYEPDTKTTSMARTTGYTCTIVARQLLKGMISHQGICPPEYLGKEKGIYEDLLSEYKKRGITLQETITKNAFR